MNVFRVFGCSGSVLFASLVSACQAASHEGAALPAGRLVVAARDTLVSPAGYAVAQPLWVSTDPARRYVVSDGSDKDLKVFDALGAAAATVGRPGPGPGEFTVLQGGGAWGDSLYAYDVLNGLLTVFDPAGRYARSVALRRPGMAMPMTARAMDDSLLLVPGFVVGSHDRDLLRVVRRDGTTRSEFFNRSRYFTPENASLVQSSVVVADGVDGVVFVGIMGSDSVYAFDYDGRLLGSGPLTDTAGDPLPSFRDLITANGGSRVTPDRTLVYEGQPAIVSLVALPDGRAAVQIMELRYDSTGRLDRTAGGTLALATLDRARRRVVLSAHARLDAGLHGRDREGGALLVRYVGDDFDQLEVSRLSVQTGSAGERRER